MPNDSSEVWRPVPGMNGRYDVSDQGNVRSWVARQGQPLPHLLTPIVRSRGHLAVKIRPDSESRLRNMLVHRLVLLAFEGEPPFPTAEVRHLDGNPTNNVRTNLRYGTRAENERDKVQHGNHNNASKTHCPAGHEYTPENTHFRNRGKWPRRECRTCCRERRRVHAS